MTANEDLSPIFCRRRADSGPTLPARSPGTPTAYICRVGARRPSSQTGATRTLRHQHISRSAADDFAKMKVSVSLIVGVLLPWSLAAPTTQDWASRQWDAIVVGAGTAGIIVADRLSEAGLTTLLLERGGSSYGITGGNEKPDWLNGTGLSRVDVPGLCKSKKLRRLHMAI